MAIYHFKVQHISRSQGRSSTAAAAYRAGALIHDERTGQSFDYRNRRGVVSSAILAPSRAPDWARDSQRLWNQVEALERRKDARVARENVIALPHELSLEENRDWLHSFVETAYVKRGMVAQVDIHAPDHEGDGRNWHAHILLSPRPITRNGFKAMKPDTWNAKKTLLTWREQAATFMNGALERAGRAERVDHRSYEDQGLTRKPTSHLGPEASKMERKGKKTRIGDENREAKAFNKHVEGLEEELAEINTELGMDAVPELYDRDAQTMAQDLAIIDAAIAADEGRPDHEQNGDDDTTAAAALTAKARWAAYFAAEEKRKELAEKTDALDKAGFWAWISGRKRRLAAEIEVLRSELDDLHAPEDERKPLRREFDAANQNKPSPAPGARAQEPPNRPKDSFDRVALGDNQGEHGHAAENDNTDDLSDQEREALARYEAFLARKRGRGDPDRGFER